MTEELKEADKRIDFFALNRSEVVRTFRRMLKENKIEQIVPLIEDIRLAYQEKAEKRYQEEFKKFRQAGGYPADFSPPKDTIDSKYKELYNIYLDRERKHREEKKDEQKANLATKQQLIEDLKQLIENEHRIGKAFHDFQKIKETWESTGPVPSRKARQLESEYHFQVELFYYNIKINKDLKELDLEKHLEQKEALIKKMNALLKEKTIKKIEAQVKEYHQQWSAIGPVPQSRKDDIINAFNEVNDKIFEKIKQHYEALREKQLENLKVKEALCKKIEKQNERTFETHKAWQKATKDVLETQKEWRKAGRVPNEQYESIWERFRTACDEFFDKKRAFYEVLKKDYEANKAKKIALCESAEAVMESTDWETTTKELIALQRQWKAVGPADPKDDYKIWNRFRKACDTFFNAKKGHLDSIEKQKEANVKTKEEFIQRLKQVKLPADATEGTEVLKAFSTEWKQIGEVPAKDMKTINEAYSAEMDKLFDQIKMDDNEKEKLKFKNKLERLSHSKQLLQNEERFLKDKIRKIEESIVQYENNLGFFAKSGKADFLKVEVEKNLDKSKEELEHWKAKQKILKAYLNRNT